MKIDDSTSVFHLPPGPATASGAGGTDESARQLVRIKNPLPEAIEGSGRTHIETPMGGLLDGINARSISPREISTLSGELYAAGILDFDEYADLAFQPELHPDYAGTIGALTGEVALPDQPRDFIKVWEEKYAFSARYRESGSRMAERALHILSVLRRLDNPTDINA